MSGLIGKKIGMTSIFDADGKNVPCTVIQAGPCAVTQVKVQSTEGYDAIQLGFEDKKEKHTSKAERGHFKNSKTNPKKKLVEFRYFEKQHELGKILSVGDVFSEGEYVDVIGTSKGKGFQGVVKRHGFKGVGQATHGQHNRLRAPGSIGASSSPSRVFKGMRMAGRMGNDSVTVQNLVVQKILPEKDLIVVKGCVPGHKNSYVIIQK